MGMQNVAIFTLGLRPRKMLTATKVVARANSTTASRAWPHERICRTASIDGEGQGSDGHIGEQQRLASVLGSGCHKGERPTNASEHWAAS